MHFTTPPQPTFPEIEITPLAPHGYRAWWRRAPGVFAEAPTKDEAIAKLQAERKEREDA